MKYIIFFVCGFLLYSCKNNVQVDEPKSNAEIEEFVEFVQTDSEGNIIGEDIEGHWSPRSNATLTSQPAYPNPVSNLFAIELELQETKNLTFEVLDQPGHVMITLLKSSFEAGDYKFQLQPDTFNPPLESGKIYQNKITSSDIEIYGNIKYQE